MGCTSFLYICWRNEEHLENQFWIDEKRIRNRNSSDGGSSECDSINILIHKEEDILTSELTFVVKEMIEQGKDKIKIQLPAAFSTYYFKYQITVEVKKKGVFGSKTKLNQKWSFKHFS